MAKTVISIEIGAASIRMAELVLGKTHQAVKKADIFDTPELAIEDGFIRDSASIAEQLKLHIQNAGMTSTKDIVFTIASSKVVSREVNVTASKEKLVKGIVQSEAVDYFPMDLADYTVTYAIIGRDAVEGTFRLMVYAAPTTLLQQYYDLASELHKEVASIDFVGNSLFQWFKRSTLSDVSLVVEINGSASILTILDHREMGVQRSIGYGVNLIANALLDAHAYDDVQTQMDAVHMLQEQTFFGIGESDDAFWRENEMTRIRTQRFKQIENEIKRPTEDADGEPIASVVSTFTQMSDEEILEKRVEARNDINAAARQLIGNIRRVIDYYLGKNPESVVQKIYLTGIGATLTGLDSMITAELQIPSEIYDVTEGIVFIRQAAAFETRGAEFLSCFGSVINPLGLRSNDAVERVRNRRYLELSGGIFAIALFAFLVVFVKTRLDISALEKDKVNLQKEIKHLEPIESLQAVYEASQTSIAFAEEMDNLVFTNAEQANDILATFENTFPSRAIVSSFQITGSEMVIDVSTVDKEEAAFLLLQLRYNPYVEKVQVMSITEEENKDTGRVEVGFSVNCVLKRYEAPVESDDNTEMGDI